MAVKSERKKAGRYAARFAGTGSASANRKSKKAAKHTKAFRTRNDSFTAEYNNASSLIYGKTIEMNRRPQKVYGKIAEYMDGSGAGKIRGDMRPLEPVFLYLLVERQGESCQQLFQVVRTCVRVKSLL